MPLSTANNVTNVFMEIGGKPAGFLTGFTPPTYAVEEMRQPLGPGGETKVIGGRPKIGEATATFSVAEGGPLFDWVTSALKKNLLEHDVAVTLADQNFAARTRVDLLGCVITGMQLPVLDAKDAKTRFEITLTFQPRDVRFSKASGKVAGGLGSKVKIWPSGCFVATVPGIEARFITRLELPRLTVKVAEEHAGMNRLPARHYTAAEYTGLKTEQAPMGFDAAQTLAMKVIADGAITDEEYVDIVVDLYDQTMKQVLGTITIKYCAPRQFSWDISCASSIEWAVEEVFFERK